jgi:hypothetical protein
MPLQRSLPRRLTEPRRGALRRVRLGRGRHPTRCAGRRRLDDRRRPLRKVFWLVGLYRRLYASLASPPEQLLFKSYCARYGTEGGQDAPALIPPVYLHYDPYTKRELRGRVGAELVRQRMDFLLLPNDRRRIVIEVDGQQMTAYEVYRFGAAELRDEASARATVNAFIDQLLAS